jgi:uncharacterized protein
LGADNQPPESMETNEALLAEDTLATVKRFFSFYQKGDVAGLKSVLHPDIEWIVPGRHPLSGTKKGMDEVIAYYRLLQRANFRSEVRFLEAQGEYAVDYHRGWAQAGAQQLETDWVMVYNVRNGLIRSMRNFPGDQHAVDDFFWSVYRLRPLPERLEM